MICRRRFSTKPKRGGATKRANGSNRKGAATLEAAITLPILLGLIFGSIETANAIHVRQTVSIAAYDAARIATKRNGTQDAAKTRCAELLESQGVNEFKISFNPQVDLSTPRATVVTVTVSVPSNSNSLGLVEIFAGTYFSKTVHMVRL